MLRCAGIHKKAFKMKSMGGLRTSRVTFMSFEMIKHDDLLMQI